MRRPRKRVLLALGYYDQRLIRGIERYAQEHGWHLSPDMAREKVIPWGWRGDGILAWLGAGDDLAEFVVRCRKPTVDFSNRRPQLNFPHVLADFVQASRLVSEHFLARGCKHFLCYSPVHNWSFQRREEAFIHFIQQAGYECQWLQWRKKPAVDSASGHDDWKHKRKRLAAALRRAPKPLAVYAPADSSALEVLELCEEIGLAVPDQVAIVGTANALLAADTMRTPLSSVDTNLETMGYRGAELLDGLMHGKPAPRQPLRVPPAGLIIRKSSDLLAINHPGVAKGLRYILNHCHEAIGVQAVVDAAGMSRRGMHYAFIEHIGRTPGEELHRVRIERAKRLLRESGQKIESLAAECGYQSANSFGVAFKNSTGLTPTQYREKSLR